MSIKIYFNDKVLFLSDDFDPEVDSYAHQDDTVFIDEFSTPAINSMLHEMKLEKIHTGILYHKNLEALKKAVFKKFTLIQAAGGVVMDKSNTILFIFRKGKWDLPKGKVDPGEPLDVCALREVKEETGLTDVTLVKPLLVTYHTYDENGKHMLKETHWFLMRARADQPVQPQEEEQITEIKWVTPLELDTYFNNTFPLIREVINAASLQQ